MTMHDVAPETLAKLDDLLRAMSTDMRQYVEDRLAEERDAAPEVADPVRRGIMLAGEEGVVESNIESLEVVGAQVQIDSLSQRGRIRVPPPERHPFNAQWDFTVQSDVSVDPAVPIPLTVGAYGRIRIPINCQILGCTIIADSPVVDTLGIYISSASGWPLGQLLGPVDVTGHATMITTPGVAPTTIFDVTNWNIHYLSPGDILMARIEVFGDVVAGPLVGLILSLDLLPLSGDDPALGTIELVDSDGAVLQDASGITIVARL